MSEQFASNDAQSTETPDNAEGVVSGTPDDVETTDAAAAEVLTQTDPASDSPYNSASRGKFFGRIRVFPVFPDFLATAANRLPNRVSKG